MAFLLRLAATTAALLGVVAAQAASAQAQVQFVGTLTTPERVDSRTRFILYYLQMRTGAQEERFSVRLVPPDFARQGRTREGQSIDGPRAVALQGPGTVVEQGQAPAFDTVCTDRDTLHGYATGAADVDVLLPPNSATTLAVRYDTGVRPPWIDSDYRLLFQARPTLAGTYDATSPFAAGPTLTRTVNIRTKGPTVGRRIGAHILLSTSPRTTTSPDRSPTKLRRGEAVDIRGSLLPRAKGRRIVLKWSHPGGRLHKIQSVRTDRRGRFTARPWRPGGRGSYELWAQYPRQRGGLLSDTTSCPLRFRVR